MQRSKSGMGSGGNCKAPFGTNGDDGGGTHRMDRLCASTGNRRGDVEETKDMGINKAEGKMKTQSPVVPHTSQGTYTRQ